MKTLIARTTSMSVGWSTEVHDLDEAERRARRTLELGRALEFPTPRINASLDLGYIAARRGRPDQAAACVAEVGDAIAAGRGFHGWIWRSRLGVLHAEIMAAEGRFADALELATSCVAGCEALGRIKYRLLAEHVLARALAGLGRREEALASARRTLDEARRHPDAAMVLRSAAAVLELDRDEAARTALVDAATRIEGALPDARAREAFRAGAPLSGVSAR